MTRDSTRPGRRGAGPSVPAARRRPLNLYIGGAFYRGAARVHNDGPDSRRASNLQLWPRPRTAPCGWYSYRYRYGPAVTAGRSHCTPQP
ncbi:hypothetical protein [Streptomyces sp. NBC_00696]|uniref:hypothetical protein n=1 Tax=Streptomyces sp. NBC_00696 TaxID=2903672 RepID=UPI002E369ADB|nr:hypothetical protein [Streptomyces sp. NBC_00696]